MKITRAHRKLSKTKLIGRTAEIITKGVILVTEPYPKAVKIFTPVEAQGNVFSSGQVVQESVNSLPVRVLLQVQIIPVQLAASVN